MVTTSASCSEFAASSCSSPAPTLPISCWPGQPRAAQQTSVRLALGASRRRLIRQALTESIVLSVLGGFAGLIVAYLGVKLIVALNFHGAKFVPIDATPSLAVLAFAFALSLVTGALFGTAPAWFASRSDPAEALRGANRSTHDRSSLPQKILVVFQATLSVVLLAGAGLLTRSLMNMQHQDFGYDTDRRVTISLTAPYSAYSQPKLDAMYRELQDRLSHMPGVERAALAQYTPLQDNWGEIVIREGHPMPSMTDQHIGSSWDHVSAGYLETLGQKIIRGRSITPEGHGLDPQRRRRQRSFRAYVSSSRAKTRSAHILASTCPVTARPSKSSASSATRNMAGTSPTANHPVPCSSCRWPSTVAMTVAMMQSIDDQTHFIEGAVLQLHSNSMEGLEPQLRSILADIDPNFVLLNIQTLQEQVDSNLDQQRAIAQMTGLFGLLALVLAAVGLYGVTAYAVERRTSEIGVRMALGANRGNVIRLVLRGAFLQILIGLAIGIPISIGCSRLIANQLYQVKGWDPLVLSLSILALGLCAFLASIIPAQRAASINPVTALRTE